MQSFLRGDRCRHAAKLCRCGSHFVRRTVSSALSAFVARHFHKIGYVNETRDGDEKVSHFVSFCLILSHWGAAPPFDRETKHIEFPVMRRSAALKATSTDATLFCQIVYDQAAREKFAKAPQCAAMRRNAPQCAAMRRNAPHWTIKGASCGLTCTRLTQLPRPPRRARQSRSRFCSR